MKGKPYYMKGKPYYMKGKPYKIRKRNSFPNAIIKKSSCYCVMILKTENDVNSKETIILRIYGSR